MIGIDDNDLGRISAAVRAGVKIMDAANRGQAAISGQAQALTLIQALEGCGREPRVRPAPRHNWLKQALQFSLGREPCFYAN